MASLAKVDLVERTSYVSSTTKHVQGEGYDAMKTPDVLEGALREGGAPHLLSRESFGLLSQYAGVGLIYGTLPSTIYPFLTAYLNMEGTQTTSAKALLSIPWCFKVFIGIISDCFPIFGYRRRPYMMLGWSLCAVCCFVMGLTPMPDSYWRDPSYIGAQDATPDMVRADAPDAGGKYIVLMMMASFGYLVADVAADAVVVEYAQREPEAVRGRTQTAIYATRYFFTIFAQLILAFGLNGKPYGGDFDFGISYATTMLILGIFCLPIIPLTWFFVAEKPATPAVFSEYIGKLWTKVQTRAVYQVMAYNFLANVFGGFYYTASDPMALFWAKATNFTINITGIIGTLITVITLFLTGKYGLHWSWRWMQVYTMFIVIAIDVVVTMCTTWDVVRHQWFWLGVPIVENIPFAISFIIGTYVVVELADEGNEGAIYGLMTTISNLGGPFALTLTKNVNGAFNVWNKDILADTKDVRTDVTYTILISYAVRIASLLFLPLLPPQKQATQELKRTGGSSKKLGGLMVFVFLFALSWSIMVNILSIFPSTKCLAVTGGCHNN